MRIKADRQRLLHESEELVDVSRQLRRCGTEIESVKTRLGGYTQLDGCKRELAKQCEAAALISARLVLLSGALQDIANLYGRTESGNTTNLEGYSSPFRGRSQMWVTSIPDDVKKQFDKLVY